MKAASTAQAAGAQPECPRRTVQKECVDPFLVCGEAHFRHFLTEFVELYNQEQPH
jgi:hypothetical protein